ncbi:MAG: hypothetical protein AB8B73_12775 [Ekhidna sp.]
MTSEDEDENRGKKPVRRSRLLTAVILIVAFTISVLIAQYAVINNYVSKNLSQFIENRINENMEADSYFHFDSLQVSVWRNRISTRNISLHLNAQTEIIAKAPALVINVGSLLKFWWDEKLLIDQIILQSPYVEVIKTNEKDTSTIDSLSFVDNVIQKINLLELKDIHLKNANIRFYEKDIDSGNKRMTFQLNDLSIDLKRLNIATDNLLDLETEKLIISLKDQQYILPDSSMQIDIKSIDYDHLHKGFDFTNISISSFPENDTILDLPYLEAHQFFVEKGRVSIDSLHIIEPNIVLNQQILDLIQKNDRKKSPLSIPLINSIEIKNIGLNDGELTGVLEDSLDFIVKNWGLSISNIGWNEADENPYHIGSTRVSLNDFRLKKPHVDPLFQLQKIRLEYPENNLFLDSMFFNLDSLNGTIVGVALYDLNMGSLVSNEFVADELIITEPSIEANISNLKIGVKDSTKKPIFDKWKIQKARVSNLDVLMNQNPHELTIDDGDIYILDFELVGGEEFTLNNLDSYTFYLPSTSYGQKKEDLELIVNNTYYNSADSLLSISTGSFRDNKTSLSWKNLNAKNETNLSQQVDSIVLSYFAIDSYKVTHDLKTKTSKKSPVLPAIIIDSLRLGKGYAKISKENSFELETSPQELLVKKLIYDSSIWQLDDLDFNINDISAKSSMLDGSINELSIQALENSILLSDIRIENKDTIQDKLQSSIASIEIKFYDFLSLLNQPDNIKLRDISIEKPEVIASSNNGSDKEVRLKVKNYWSDDLPNIVIDQLKIIDGAFEKNANDNQLDFSGFNLQLSTIELSDDSLYFDKNLNGLLYAQSYTGFISEINFQNVLDSVSINDIEIGEVISTSKFLHTSNDIDRVVAFDRIRLEGFQPNEWLINNRLKARSFLIDHPHVKVKQRVKDSINQKPDAIHVILDSIDVINAELDLEWGDKQALKLSPLNISLGEFEYDAELEVFQWPAKTYEISTRNMEFRTENGLNLIQLDKVTLNNSQLEVSDLTLEPLLGKEDYFKKIGYETDHINLTIPSIRLETFDQQLLLKDSILNAARLIVEEPTLDIFRDQNYPDPDPLYKIMPVSAIQSIPFPMRIDTVEVVGARVAYEMIPENGVEPGIFTFADLDATFSNITNNPIQNEVMNVFVTANAMDIIPMYLSFDFDLNSENDEFSFKGSVAPHDMTTFNQYTENGAFVKVISGATKNLSFAVQANDTLGYGTMDFVYNNLKIAMLDKKTYSQSNVDESVVSFIANTFFVRKRNRFTKYRQGDIYFERIQHKAIFNFLAKLLISGTASSVGFKNYKKEVKIVKEASKEAEN